MRIQYTKKAPGLYADTRQMVNIVIAPGAGGEDPDTRDMTREVEA